MALPAPSLRNKVADLTADASRDLAALWREVADAAAAETVLRDVLPAVIEQYGAAAATLATVWYDDLRDKAAVAGAFTAIPIEAHDRGAQALVGWALNTATDYPSFQSLILGGTQRRIADHARGTVMTSSVADPKSQGWQRVSSGGCSNGFCDMLAARGLVYSESSADFASHDNCRCYAIPAFDGAPRPVRPYSPSKRNITDADRANTRDWLRTH